MNKCERCGARKSPTGEGAHDYCAECGKNLCPACMAEGCCGQVPAESGMKADYGDDEE
jgi:uncharacterized protein CbrC (UPF0167 family)